MSEAARPWRLPGRTRFAPIQLRIFLAFGTTLALALAVGGWAVARYFSRVANRQIESQQADLARLVASSMDDKITTYLGSLEAEARSCPPGLERDGPAAQRWLEDRLVIRSMFENGTFLVRPDGHLLAGVPGARLPEGQAPFIQGLASTGKPGISEAYRSATSANPAVLMAAPVRDGQGRTRLLLAGAIDLTHDDFLGTLSNQQMADASRLSLMDENGRILMHEDRSRLLQHADLRRWGDLLRERAEGTGERVDASGVPTLTSVRRLRAVPWVLAAILPESAATTTALRFRRYLQWAVAATVPLALLLTWALSHRLTENLEDLTRQVEGAAGKDPGQRVHLRKANDETGLLVDAFNGLLARLENNRATLIKAQAQSDEELVVARHVLQRLVEPGLAALPPQFHMETLQVARINGDACTYQEGPAGLHFGLLCDATGHGLTAGISTLPAIQAFLSMVARDVPLETMYREINQRIHQLMPVGRFLCLLLIRLDLRNGTLSVLNAGLPDAILCTTGGGRRRFESRNLPAGILAEEEPVIETVAVAPGERLFACTDGVLELFETGDAEPWLLRGLDAGPLAAHRRAIQEALTRIAEDRGQRDDLSWALWEVPPLLCARIEPPGRTSDPVPSQLDEGFRLDLVFQPQNHAARDLLPDVIRLLSDRGLGAREGQILALTLTEALANAVDHGLLGLDPDLKSQGFEAYEALRRLHLAGLQKGSVRLSIGLRTQPCGPIQEVVVEVEDTGPGFDWRAWDLEAAGASSAPSGRGLLLIRALSKDLTFNETGNRIRFTLPCG
jgi:serine phosphatase RsbU (regulator of sigma subunit)